MTREQFNERLDDMERQIQIISDDADDPHRCGRALGELRLHIIELRYRLKWPTPCGDAYELPVRVRGVGVMDWVDIAIDEAGDTEQVPAQQEASPCTGD